MLLSHPIEEADTNSIFGSLTAEQFYEKHGVKHEEEYMTNARGMKIFTQSWQPAREGHVKGVILVLHGFTGDSSWSIQLTSIGIAERGFCVYALDHQGHGRSDGLRAHIPDLNPVIDDCIMLSNKVREKRPRRRIASANGADSTGNPSPDIPDPENPYPCPYFLFGESLGGAIALLMHFKEPDAWDGIILNGAMCGISQKFKPPWPMEHLLGVAAALIPTWPVVPTKSIGPVSFKEPWKLELMTKNPSRITLKPRPATAREFLRAVAEIESRLEEVRVPLLIIHGEMDVVCDPAGVSALYRKASSSDKTLKMYEGLWHQVVGEPKENLDIVFSDIIAWLEARSS